MAIYFERNYLIPKPDDWFFTDDEAKTLTLYNTAVLGLENFMHMVLLYATTNDDSICTVSDDILTDVLDIVNHEEGIYRLLGCNNNDSFKKEIADLEITISDIVHKLKTILSGTINAIKSAGEVCDLSVHYSNILDGYLVEVSYVTD